MPTIPAAANSDTSRPRLRAVAFVEFCIARAVLVVSACIATALLLNVFAPFWAAFVIGEHQQAPISRSSLPADGAAFPDRVGNVAYVVVENSAVPQPTADTYLGTLAERLRGAALAGVRSVVNQSADPLTAPIAQSDDNRVAYIDLRLKGAPGSVEASSAIRAARAVVAGVPAPAGINSYVSGPGAASAARAAQARADAQRIAVGVVGAMVLLVIVVARSKATSAMVLASAAIALLVALSIDTLLASPALSPSGPALIVALTMGSILHYAQLMRGGYRRHCRNGSPSHATVSAAYRSSAQAGIASAPLLLFSLASVTLVDPPQLLGLGISIAAGVAVGILLCCACAERWIPNADAADHIPPIPAVARRLSQRLTMTTYRHASAVLALTALIVAAGVGQLSRVDAAPTPPQLAPINSEAARGYAAVDKHFGDDRLRPLSILVRADHDLRNPAGLMAIERVTHRLLELPAATRVQSAAWPAGVPRPEFTVAYQLGELNRELQSEGMSAISLTDSLQRLRAITGELTSTVDQIERGLAAGTAGLSSAGATLADLRSTSNHIQATLNAVSGYADPVRRFIAANPDCTADTVCSLTQRVIQPIDSLLADTSRVVAGADTLPDSISAVRQVLASASSTLPQVRADLTQFRTVIDEFAKALHGALPEATKVTSLLNVMTADLSAGGAGDFYLPQSQIDSASYARIKARMFSADGHATRLLLYVKGISPSDRDLSESAASEVRRFAKYGALAGASVECETLDSTEPIGAYRVRGIAAQLILLAAITALTIGVAFRSILIGIGVAGATLASAGAGFGAAMFLASTLPGRTDWRLPLLALLVALPVISEDGFQVARRWVGWRRRDGSACALSTYRQNPTIAIAAAIWAAVVMGATAFTAAGLSYVGLTVLCCLGLSYLCLRCWLIVAAAHMPKVARRRAPE